MEQTTVTHQPGLSVTKHSPSAFVEEDAGGLATGSEANRRSIDAPAATDPILTQPGLGVTTTTITTITQTGGGWSSGLFDICGDKTSCVLGALVPCCLDLSLAHQYGECLWTPLLPGSTFAMRVGIRERYKIRGSGRVPCCVVSSASSLRVCFCVRPVRVCPQGSVCEDWTTVCCCYPLAVCQMIREMKRRMKTQTYHVSTALECS
ncbi:PLAC8-like protein 1 isoform X1 [Hippoglossus stenolepis]|uniref:PLAC8-like protein 1 isoform X1 n=1 Tax=Hippoglossus stenolepis TaxID=195615 RepID=UPI00159C4C3E|nr:PLAC8-like protein 1 isoform X1 [Hippoglossus stenolepis]